MKLLVVLATLVLLTGCGGMVVLNGHYDYRGNYSYYRHHHYPNYYYRVHYTGPIVVERKHKQHRQQYVRPIVVKRKHRQHRDN